MLIVINGTLGVGKTWISRWLLGQLEDAAYIDGDVLGFVSSNLIQQRSRNELAIDVALDLITSFRRKGANTIVFDRLFVDPALLDSFISRAGLPVRIFYLSASPETIASRIQSRARPHAPRELTEAPEIEKTQRASFSQAQLGFEINTDGLTPEDVVERIKKQLSC
jgi:thymidylate kinase